MRGVVGGLSCLLKRSVELGRDSQQADWARDNRRADWARRTRPRRLVSGIRAQHWGSDSLQVQQERRSPRGDWERGTFPAEWAETMLRLGARLQGLRGELLSSRRPGFFFPDREEERRRQEFRPWEVRRRLELAPSEAQAVWPSRFGFLRRAWARSKRLRVEVRRRRVCRKLWGS